MVQMKKLAALRRAWEAKGNPPCDHPNLDKEYDLGGDTDAKGCLTCGASFTRAELREMGR